MVRWKLSELSQAKDFFKVLGNSDHMQVASMCLKKGEARGEYGTDHPGADQLIFVIAGLGEAKISGDNHELWPGDLILIEAGEEHQIRGKSEEPLQTINFYSPMAYPDEAKRF
jgi:quercetin dioxygenase-like cupin family protein